MIEKIFYEVINEAKSGTVNCENAFNTYFDTIIDNKLSTSHAEYESTIKPTLIIEDKETFFELLNEYVKLAMTFYKEDNALQYISEYNQIKSIITLLFSNASSTDFINPNTFLRKRIAFFKNSLYDYQNSFYLDSFKGKLNISFIKDSVMNESPYCLKCYLENDNGERYYFPNITVGIYNNEACIYSIQSKETNDNTYSKKINRILYKINDGFDASNDNYELYEEGNLKDVTASFLFATNILIDILKKYNIKKVNICNFLPVRYNAKAISYQKKLNYYANVKKDENKVEETKAKIDMQDSLQSNLTEKFLRTFLRLAYHKKGIEVSQYPDEVFAETELLLNNNEENNNKLLQETDLKVK